MLKDHAAVFFTQLSLLYGFSFHRFNSEALYSHRLKRNVVYEETRTLQAEITPVSPASLRMPDP
jgi:hypothetical protein